jgi:hypothetical protein
VPGTAIRSRNLRTTSSGSGQPPPTSFEKKLLDFEAIVSPSATTSNCPVEPFWMRASSPSSSWIFAARPAARRS